MDRIGIIGLGRMGAAIAQRVVAQGAHTMGWTRSGRSVEGVQSAPDLAALVAGSDTVILSLYDDAAVRDVLEALVALDLTGKLIIDTSTVSPDTLKSRLPQIEARGGTAVDAPISGGPEMVLSGQCGVFLGGNDRSARRALEVVKRVTERVFHVGPLGSGLAMKVVNNGMLQVYIAGLLELLPVAKQSGLSLETTLKVLCSGPAGMPMVTARIPKILGKDKEVGFPLEGAFKDNGIFRDVVNAFGLSAPTMESFGNRKQEMADAGLLQADPAAMIRFAFDGASGPDEA